MMLCLQHLQLNKHLHQQQSICHSCRRTYKLRYLFQYMLHRLQLLFRQIRDPLQGFLLCLSYGRSIYIPYAVNRVLYMLLLYQRCIRRGYAQAYLLCCLCMYHHNVSMYVLYNLLKYMWEELLLPHNCVQELLRIRMCLRPEYRRLSRTCNIQPFLYMLLLTCDSL